jgi:hypothetical protein
LKGEVIPGRQQVVVGLKALVNQRRLLQTAAETAARQSMDQGLKQAKVMVKGAGLVEKTATVD